jgi:predicted ribosome quality control (RQC) complex YloA/Tae2 family protein
VAESALHSATEKLRSLDAAIEEHNEEYLTSLLPSTPKQAPQSKKKKAEAGFKGARRFVSSDGFEILVGKKAKDNDYLTFRIASSLDLWLHAADYPGSHVVVRNKGKKEIPNRTLVEAAELAAFYSDAREQPKTAVNYTQKKFVNKPRRAAAGLVSLASFKTILVEPRVSVSSS